MLNAVKRAFGYFDDYGLKYSIDHLNSVDHRQLLEEPLDRMARYHDAVTEDLIANEPASLPLLYLDMRNVQFPINTTAIGNAAYIATHSLDKKVKDDAFRVLSSYRQWLKKQQ